MASGYHERASRTLISTAQKLMVGKHTVERRWCIAKRLCGHGVLHSMVRAQREKWEYEEMKGSNAKGAKNKRCEDKDLPNKGSQARSSWRKISQVAFKNHTVKRGQESHARRRSELVLSLHFHFWQPLFSVCEDIKRI